MANTTRWALPYPALDGSDAADVPFWMNALAVALDGVAMDDQGTLANRPTSTSGNPGKRGRYYMVVGDSTAANNGILWRDNGTGWDQVGGGTIFDTTANRPVATAVPKGTRYYSTDQIAEWVSDGTNWHRLGVPVGDISLTNESSARAGYILLDGAAWPSTTGIYADLHTLWGGANLPDARGRSPVALGTNAAVNTLLANDGVAVTNRRGTKHRHTPHAHGPVPADLQGLAASLGAGINSGGGSGSPNVQYGIINTDARDGGSQVSTDPLDGGAFLVLQPQAKL